MFSDGAPVLVVRAHIDDGLLPDFRRWYRSIQLPHMLAVPGVVGARSITGPRRGDLNWMVAYEFAVDSEIQEALQSEEAQLARDDWRAWAEHVDGLSIEIYVGLAALPALHHWN